MLTKFLPPDWDARSKNLNTKVKRCGNVTGCNLPINFEEPHINLEDRTFCCQDCLQSYLDTEQRLENATALFREDRPPRYLTAYTGEIEN